MSSSLPLEGTVMWLTWRQLFARRRIWFALAFSLAPLLFTLIFKLVADDGDASRVGFFSGLGRDIILGTLLPLAAVVLGTTALGGDIDDGTIVYLLVKPIVRWRIVTSKLVVATLSAIAVMIPAVLLPWLVVRGPDLPGSVAVAFLAAAAAGAVLYSAIFLLLGIVTRRALVIGLVYVIIVEGILSRTFPGLKSFSVREFAVAIAQSMSDGKLTPLPFVVPMGTVWKSGGTILGLACVLAIWKLARYEMAERP